MRHLIIGGGFAGLLEAKRLLATGASVTVAEKHRFGGALASASMAGINIDTGAEAFATADSSMFKVLTELGLSEQIVFPTPLSAKIISEQARYPIPRGYMGIPASLDDPELIAVISSAGIAQAKDLDSAVFGEYETVADLVTARLGEEFLTKLVAPVMAGVHSSSPDKLLASKIFRPLLAQAQSSNSLIAAIAQLRANSPRPGSAVASLAGGLHQIIPRLVESLVGAELIENAELAELHQTASGFDAVLEGRDYVFDELVSAAGYSFTSRFIEIAASQLETSVVTLLVNSAALNSAPLGSGALITKEHSIQAKATTHLNAKWQWIADSLPRNQHLIRVSYGLDGALPTEDLIALASSELGLIYDLKEFEILDARADIWPSTLVRNPIASTDDSRLRVVGALVSGNGLSGIAKDHLERNAA